MPRLMVTEKSELKEGEVVDHYFPVTTQELTLIGLHPEEVSSEAVRRGTKVGLQIK